MAKDWTDEEVRALISDSVRIVHEDRERTTYKSLHEKYGTKEEPAPEEPKEGDPPPAKDPKKSAAEKTPRKLWRWSEDG
jgi:hypothetical protein